MKNLLVIFLLLFVITSGAYAQLLVTETFNYPNDGGLADLTWLSATSPYYPQTYSNLSGGTWSSTATSAFIGPLLVETGALTYPGYGLSGLGKKVYLPTATSGQARQSARVSFAGATKVYYAMMVQIKEAYQLGDMTSDLNGTTIASLNTSTSSSGIRGLLVYNRSLTPGKIRVGVSYTRDDAGTAFALADLDTLSTHFVVVSVDTVTNTASLWLNPTISTSEPTPDAVNTNISVNDLNTLKYFTIYQRDNKPSGWIGGVRIATTWADLFAPIFSVNSNSINMGLSHVYQPKLQPLIVSNTGLDTLKITSAVSDNSRFTISPTSANIAPGASFTFNVTGTLITQAPQIGNITFMHNDVSGTDVVAFTLDARIPASGLPMIEVFNYPAGDLTSGTTATPLANVSNYNWFNTGTSALTDTLRVKTGPLTYLGYILSGQDNRLDIYPNKASDKAFRPFSNTPGEYKDSIYYSLLLKMSDIYALSSYPSTSGEALLGVGAVTNPDQTPASPDTNRYSKGGIRGVLRFRAGSIVPSFQLGVSDGYVKPANGGPVGWHDVNLDTSLTYLVVVKYKIGDSISLWINPDLSLPEGLPNVRVSTKPSVQTQISDFGSFAVIPNGDKPRCALDGIQVTQSWPAQPAFSVAPSSIDFSNLLVGATHKDSLTVTNTGLATLGISSVLSTNSMFTVNPVSASIPAGSNQIFEVTFAPTAAGSQSGEIQFVHNAVGSPGIVTVNGTGTQPVFSVNPSSVDFGTVIVNQTGSGSVTVTNDGTAILNVSTELISLTSVTVNPTTASISVGGSQVFNINWSPASAGSMSGTLRFNHDAPSSPADLPVSGTSILSPVFSISQTSLNFGGIAAGSKTFRTITVTNTGSASLEISEVTSSAGSMSVTPATSTIAAGGNQKFTLSFEPASSGDYSGEITFTHNASGSPSVVSVTGKGLSELVLLRENFSYSLGGLTTKTDNVSGGLWINNSSNPPNDSIMVESGSLIYPEYSLSGLGNKIRIPNLTGTFDPDRAYRAFSNSQSEYAGQIYYAMMLKLTDLGGLSSATSSYGELLTGVGPVSPVPPSTDRFTKTSLRGMLRFRLGTTPNTFALGVNTSSAKTGPMGWVPKDISLDSTVLVVVRYRPNDSVSLWINPSISSTEPTPDITVAKDPVITEVIDFGHFYIMTQGGKPHAWLDGIRIGNTWNAIAMQDSFTVTATSSSGGSVVPSGSVTVVRNGSASFTFVANPKYVIDSIFVDGVYIPDSVTSYTFSDITLNHTLHAVFSVAPLYQVMYRSFDPDSIAGSKDLKTKYKYIARKANACEFEFDLTAPQSV
ncbi:MAG: choice-of-anchor D domain-containing protein, partial [Ignavibacteriales bacterium]|nr:choice-of-anchor D domain-containing protein [Ignavibacteriales bacterium]